MRNSRARKRWRIARRIRFRIELVTHVQDKRP
jgi:hypothetical protein